MRCLFKRLRGAALCGFLLAVSTTSHAGYDLSISHSDTDPDVNTAASPIGIDELYLWLKCANEGMAAFEAQLDGDMTVLGFTPATGVLRAPSDPEVLSIAVSDCPTGSSVDRILGTITVWDSSATGARLSLVSSPAFPDPVAVSCDTTGYQHAFLPRICGFSSDGGDPDTTGSGLGCGYFPQFVLIPGAGGGAFDWSPSFSSTGLGVDGPVTVIERSESNGNNLIAAGDFTQVGSVSAPGMALFVGSTNEDNIEAQGYWDSPNPWSALPSGTGSPVALHENASGDLGVGTSGGYLCVHDGTSWDAFVPSVTGEDVDIRGVRYWSANDTWLVVGNWLDSPWPGNRCLGQFDLNATPPFYWESFGEGLTGATSVAVDPEWNGNEVTAITSIARSGSSLDQAIVIGGKIDFLLVDSEELGTANAVLLKADGTFEDGELPGPTYSFTERPAQTALYAAGDFGEDPSNPGKAYAAVWAMDLVNYSSGASFGPLPGGGTPLKVVGELPAYPVIESIFIFDEHLYAVGDFNRVLTSFPDGDLKEAAGFARYSFATEAWEALGSDALDGPGLAGARTGVGVMVGGDFATVGGSVASENVGVLYSPEAVATPEVSQALAPLSALLYSPFPNPSREGGSQIAYLLPRTMDVSLSIYDVRGRKIRTLISRERQSAGQYSIHWDGRDDAGHRAASSVYFARLEAGDETISKRVSMIH